MNYKKFISLIIIQDMYVARKVAKRAKERKNILLQTLQYQSFE